MRSTFWIHLETCTANLPCGEFKFFISLNANLAIAYVASVRMHVIGSLAIWGLLLPKEKKTRIQQYIYARRDTEDGPLEIIPPTELLWF